MSTSFEPPKGKELLKPPEVKPVLTIFLMLICAFNTGKGDMNWLFTHAISGQSIAQALATTAPAPTVVNTATPKPPPGPPAPGSKPPPGSPPPQEDGIGYFLGHSVSTITNLVMGCTFGLMFQDGKYLDEAMRQMPRMSGMFPGSPIAAYIDLVWTSAIGQITIYIMFLNLLFIWLFGNVVEKKLIEWRYIAFLASAVLVPPLCVYFTSSPGTAEYQARIVGPTLMTMFLMGGYMCFMPKKPWKPAEWKPPRWKVFKGNDERQRTLTKVPWVNPWTYVGLFAGWTGIQQAVFFFSRSDVVNWTHQVWVGNIYSTLAGTVSSGMVNILTPIPAVLSVIAGAIFAQIYYYVGTTTRYKRDSSDLQVQAVLQYKELRALDMNHNQALEGTSKLIGVPLDICKDWITKGLQPLKDEQ